MTAAARTRPTCACSARSSSTARCSASAARSRTRATSAARCREAARARRARSSTKGLHLPPVRYQRRFKPRNDIERIIGANSRTPELVLGDIRGQLGSDRARRAALSRTRCQNTARRQSSPASTGCSTCRSQRAAPRSLHRMDGRPLRGRALRRRRRHRSRKAGAHPCASSRRRATASFRFHRLAPTRPRGRRTSARRWCRPPAPIA